MYYLLSTFTAADSGDGSLQSVTETALKPTVMKLHVQMAAVTYRPPR